MSRHVTLPYVWLLKYTRRMCEIVTCACMDALTCPVNVHISSGCWTLNNYRADFHWAEKDCARVKVC